MPTLDSDPANGLDNYDVADLSDDPFASPPPEASNKKRKEPDSGLGIDEEVDVKKRARAPNVKLDEERLLGPKGIPKLRQRARDLKIKGKGHEFSDASRLLSFYQLWLDDLFPKAKFLDALSMVEKAGHKKRVMIARNEYINESKPTDTVADDEEGDLFGQDSTSRPTDEATMRLQVTERPRTPGQNRDVPDDDDLYGATPRPSRPIVPIRNDIPEEDDLEALIAEAEGRDRAQKTRPTQTEPDEDDLDALMAEAEGQEMTKKPEPPGLDPDEDDLDALMAEAESQEQTTKRDGKIRIENNKSGNAYEDEEAAMQEMNGLW
ncbi:replication fork protection complex subunit csm3/swi3 [Fusarium sporotrichioides]|uniref:Chromosome segregation in meiosis protein n=1 Tax=Fusarium sporotrichioides TaxID=5514 RepID=A0A395RFD5_FUSSP|nr:replication fork protection complex subunit csm3/swi3 [Fusarium sporotrichioides]